MSNPDAIVTQHAKEILLHLNSLPYEVREIIVRHVINSTQGRARWTKIGPNVNDEAELDDYMFEVAGRVGYLMPQLLAWYSQFIRRKETEIMPLAREFGLGLQTVNVIRGSAATLTAAGCTFQRNLSLRWAFPRNNSLTPNIDRKP